LAATGFQYHRSVDFSQVPRRGPLPEPSDSLTFTFSLATEPKLPILSLGEVKVTAAYDDQHRSMVPLANPKPDPDLDGPAGLRFAVWMALNDPEGSGNRKNYVMNTQTALIRPAKDSRTVQSIRGTVAATLLMEQRPEVVVEDILRAKGKIF